MAKFKHLIAASLAFLPAVIQAQNIDKVVVVYRGPASSNESSQYALSLAGQFKGTVAVPFGPQGWHDLDSWALSDPDMYIQPGGTGATDIHADFGEMRKYSTLIRDYVWNGGRYLGIGAGAYMAGTDQFGFFARYSIWTSSPFAINNASHDRVNWTWSTGPKAGQTTGEKVLLTENDAVTIMDVTSSNNNISVLGHYSDGQVAASISRFGKGWVGLLGFHPPDSHTWAQGGINNDIASDLFKALMAREPGK